MPRPASSAPKDADGVTMQVLRPMAIPGAHQISVTVTSVRNSTAFNTNTRAVELWSTEDMRFRFGDSNVTAIVNTDHFLPREVARSYAIGGDVKVGGLQQATHIAAIRESTDGTLEVSELE